MHKVTAIIATRGDVPLSACIDSLLNQSVPVEIIVVDQGAGTYSKEACSSYGEEKVRVIMCDGVGASLGRNRGLEYATGAFIIFPDDDCYYGKGFLSSGIAALNSNCCDFVAGLSYTPGSRSQNHVSSASGGERAITNRNLLYSFIEYTVLFRADVFSRLRFNEAIGVGAQSLAWSDEGVDLLFRALRMGYRGRFMPQLRAYHPEKIIAHHPATYRRAFRYSVGRGYILGKYWFGLGVLLREYVRPLLAMFAYGLKFDWRAKYYFFVLSGKVYGFLYRPDNAKK